MLNKLESRWDLLATDHLHPVFQLCDATHPLDFYIGRDTQGQRLLLLITPEAPPTIRDMRAIRIRTFKRDDGKWSLLLELHGATLSPMFSMLCNDLIESSRNANLTAVKSLSFVLKRLSNWRRLLERGLPDILSESEIRGLCGELLFLRRLFVPLGKSCATGAWVGPKHAEQDFQAPDAAWEVKTIRPGAHSVTISSESQLQTTTRTVQLAIFELADAVTGVPGSFSLTTLIDSIRADLSNDHDAYDVFEERLVDAGYAPRPEYSELVFVEQSLEVFAITKFFPRITGETIAPGISHVVYDLLLSACEEFRVAPQPPTNKKDK